MKVLRSTKKTQGQRPDDFCWVPDGELVKFGSVCDSGSQYHSCGCERSMTGVLSHKATTTFEVVDDPNVTLGRLAITLADSWANEGWTKQPRVYFINQARLLRAMAKGYPAGTVLGIRSNGFFYQRQGDSTAGVGQAKDQANPSATREPRKEPVHGNNASR